MTATAMNGGMIALIGFGGLILGGALGAVIAVLVNKNKKKKETA
jgi:ABC-type lipoprotein release transport system permease subunit